ncbi:RNA polymerase sigma factor [Bacillus sp. FJAT-49705]|uniref:RNA polymerase sigma factor n=1 Tax=Cytobacillus citreus TaxID=2833586 RepID=A0ABS5NZL2_9BACI|nr:RNA polymerase sigma factor [Cytobacillus citreus]MBS4192528.1 RNA polymerase sigma factor [Cytobacillus citreus]
MRVVKEEDEEAFGQLYTLLKPSLFSFLFRYTRDEQLSADLVQDAFMKLHRYKNNFHPDKGSVKTYLFQIAYSLMITKLNRRKKWRSLIPFLIPQSSEEAINSADRITIREAIMKLPENHRAVILLSYYHDMPHAEIAEIIGIPVGTVKSRLHHSLKALRKLLEVEELEQRKSQ